MAETHWDEIFDVLDVQIKNGDTKVIPSLIAELNKHLAITIPGSSSPLTSLVQCLCGEKDGVGWTILHEWAHKYVEDEKASAAHHAMTGE